LGEYDALPGIGHGCGHNLMGTAAVGAFLALRDTLDGVRGRVRLIGCPAEERGNGKVLLMASGAFEGVDAALMYHPGDRDEIDPLMLAMVNLDVELLGKAAHAAAEPYDGVNALDGLVLGWNAMSALRLLVRSDSRIHGIITDGGKAANIIPDRAAARLMVRSPDNAYLADLRRRVLACFEGAAVATGAELRPMWSEVCEVVNTNRPLAEAFAENVRSRGRTMQPRRSREDRTSSGSAASRAERVGRSSSSAAGPAGSRCRSHRMAITSSDWIAAPRCSSAPSAARAGRMSRSAGSRATCERSPSTKRSPSSSSPSTRSSCSTRTIVGHVWHACASTSHREVASRSTCSNPI